jgi:hypothetical protein
MVRRKEVAVASVAAAGLAVTARVVMGMLRRSHSGESRIYGPHSLGWVGGWVGWIWGILGWPRTDARGALFFLLCVWVGFSRI